jgi:hypothetical protein
VEAMKRLRQEIGIKFNVALCFWEKLLRWHCKGNKVKPLQACGVLAVIWVLWMERNTKDFVLKIIEVQGWRSFGME